MAFQMGKSYLYIVLILYLNMLNLEQEEVYKMKAYVLMSNIFKIDLIVTLLLIVLNTILMKMFIFKSAWDNI